MVALLQVKEIRDASKSFFEEVYRLMSEMETSGDRVKKIVRKTRHEHRECTNMVLIVKDEKKAEYRN